MFVSFSAKGAKLVILYTNFIRQSTICQIARFTDDLLLRAHILVRLTPEQYYSIFGFDFLFFSHSIGLSGVLSSFIQKCFLGLAVGVFSLFSCIFCAEDNLIF